MWGRAVILLPYRRWAGVSGSSSTTSDETWVSGLSFKMVSLSTVMVSSVVKLIDAHPSTFFRVVLVRPINRSQNPPYYGALFGMNCQSTPCLPSDFQCLVEITRSTLQLQTGMWRHYQKPFAEEQISKLQICDMQGERSALINLWHLWDGLLLMWHKWKDKCKPSFEPQLHECVVLLWTQCLWL